MEISTCSLTFSYNNVANAVCFIPALYDGTNRKTITDVYCAADGMYTTGHSLCFEYSTTEDTEAFPIFVRDETGQWYESEQVRYQSLLGGYDFAADVEKCDDPRHSGGGAN